MMEYDEILKNIITKYNLDPYENYKCVGATIVVRINSQEYTKILFCEDGFTNENGIPYVMEANIPNGYNRDRIIVLYTHDMNRILIPVEGDNWTLIGNEIPENVRNIDFDKAEQIFHRKALEIRREPEKLSGSDIENLKKIYRTKYKRGRLTVAGLLTNIIWFILIGLVVCFTVYYNQSMHPAMFLIVFLGGIMGWIAACIFTVRFFQKIPLKIIKKFAYRSEFLVEYADTKKKVIAGLVYEDGLCRRKAYGIAYYDTPLLEEMKYFDVVYRYSKKPYPDAMDYCMFIKKHD